MKKYILYILTGVAACGLCSCEDALDRYPKDRLTPDNFFLTEEECQLYTNDFYTMFPSAGTIYGETADIIAKTTLTSEVLGNRTVPATAGSWKWEKLRDINFFLQYSSNCADEHVRLEYEGVARFFRAWFYFEKVKHYGDVPWVDRPIDAGDPLLFEKGRDPREMVMQKVIEDLDFAVTNLPVERSVYRVTRWAALALKSRVCLFEGTFRKYHGSDGYESYLRLARRLRNASSTRAVTDLHDRKHALPESFLVARARHGNRPRPGVQHLHRSETRRERLSHQHHDGASGAVEEHRRHVPDERRHALSPAARLETMQLLEESKNRDGRLHRRVRTPGYKRMDDTAESALNPATMTGYQLVKYLQSAKYDSYNASTNDLPLLRAAEVMLNYAEAKAELGNPSRRKTSSCRSPCCATGRGSRTFSLTGGQRPSSTLSGFCGDRLRQRDGRQQGRDPRNPPRTHRRTADGEPPLLGHHALKEAKRFRKALHGLYFGTGSYDLNGDGVDDARIWSGVEARDLGGGGLRTEQGDFLSGGDSGYIIIHTDYARSWNEERDYLYPVPTDDRVLTQGAITQNPG